MSVHPSKLEGLAGDYDGDKGNANSIMEENANNEVTKYNNSFRSMITPTGDLYMGASTKNTALAIFNLSRVPKGHPLYTK
jgi:hypothetical protein